jgi:hypothetical protein
MSAKDSKRVDVMVWIVGAILSLAVAVLGYVYSPSIWEAVMGVVLCLVLTCQVQILYIFREGDPVYGPLVVNLKGSFVEELLIEFLKRVGEVVRSRDDGLSRARLASVLGNVNFYVAGIRAGKFLVSLAPGGDLASEFSSAEYAKHSQWATSYVAAEKYWSTGEGIRMLESNSRQRSTSNIKITRIFIEPRGNLQHLKKIITDQIAAGVEVYVVEVDPDPSRDVEVKRDISIVDGAEARGTYGAELFLTPGRDPLKVEYYARSHPVGDGDIFIDELMRIWKRLEGRRRTPAELGL